jgi:G3E family GTPase
VPTTPAIPVTLLTGFLGSGKTTLVNRILSEPHGERIAVIVNEFGDVGIDGDLVLSSAERIVELANGCVCCTVRGDLQQSLKELLKAREKRFFGKREFDRVLIETSGLAAPGPIAQTLVIDPELANALRLDGILTMAHAVNLPRQLEQQAEAAQQIAYADRVIIGHADRATPEELETCRQAVTARNSLAEILVASRADVPIPPLLAIGTTRDDAWEFVDAEHEHVHNSDVSCVALRTTEPLDLAKLKIWLQFLGTRRSHELYRIKGILRCADRAERVVVQGMYEWLELGPSDEPAPEESALVVIGRDLDRAELERGWAACR